MTKAEIEKRIENIENAMFYEKMRNFIRWDYYNTLDKELNELKAKLKEM